MKNLIIIALLFVIGSNLSGQQIIDSVPSSQRLNCVLLNGLFGSTKVGVGVRYKSLYKLNDFLQVGWGIGVESYSSNFKRNFIPLSIDIVGDIFANEHSPFYMCSIGYGFTFGEDPSFAEDANGGLMIDLSIGYRSKKKTAQPFIAVGYRIQNAYYRGTDDYGNTNKDVVYKRWCLSTGVLF